MSTRGRLSSSRKDRIALEVSSDEEERTPFTSEKYSSIDKDSDSQPERTLRSKLYFGATVIFFVLMAVGIYHYWTIVHDFFIFPPTTLPPNVLSMLEAEGLSIASDLRSVGTQIASGAVSVGTQIATGAVSVGTQIATGAVSVGTQIAGGVTSVGGVIGGGVASVGGDIGGFFQHGPF